MGRKERSPIAFSSLLIIDISIGPHGSSEKDFLSFGDGMILDPVHLSIDLDLVRKGIVVPILKKADGTQLPVLRQKQRLLHDGSRALSRRNFETTG